MSLYAAATESQVTLRRARVTLTVRVIKPLPGSTCDLCGRDYQTAEAVITGRVPSLPNSEFRVGVACASCVHSLQEDAS